MNKCSEQEIKRSFRNVGTYLPQYTASPLGSHCLSKFTVYLCAEKEHSGNRFALQQVHIPGFDPVSVHMECMVDKVAMSQVPLPIPRKSLTSVI